MDAVVAIHNNMNELTWKKVLDWEKLHCDTCENPRLIRFVGRPDELTPKAALRYYLGLAPRPFDRHDWTVDRCGTEVRYVIDYYDVPEAHGKDRLPQLDEEGAVPSIWVDVRPALDSPTAAVDRCDAPKGRQSARHQSMRVPSRPPLLVQRRDPTTPARPAEDPAARPDEDPAARPDEDPAGRMRMLSQAAVSAVTAAITAPSSPAAGSAAPPAVEAQSTGSPGGGEGASQSDVLPPASTQQERVSPPYVNAVRERCSDRMEALRACADERECAMAHIGLTMCIAEQVCRDEAAAFKASRTSTEDDKAQRYGAVEECISRWGREASENGA